MSTYNDNTIETLRLQTPEELGHQRVYEFTESLALIERSLNAMGWSLTDELPQYPTVPKSNEVVRYEKEPSQLTARATAEDLADLMESRAREDAINASQAGTVFPTEWLENANA